jgi:hypothetical protein
MPETRILSFPHHAECDKTFEAIDEYHICPCAALFRRDSYAAQKAAAQERFGVFKAPRKPLDKPAETS